MNTISKLLVLCLISLCLAGCGEFFTGKKKVTIDEDGKKHTTYEEAPIAKWATTLAVLVPTLGGAVVAAGNIARNAARTRDGMMDANEEAIENTDWSQVNTAESVKLLLSGAQASQDDSKLLAKGFKKWNDKRKKKKVKFQIKDLLKI